MKQACRILACGVFVLCQSAWAVDCGNGSITLSNQEQVDDFQATYGNGGICDTIIGSLTIRDHPDNTANGLRNIDNLDGLGDLVAIDGHLYIRDNRELNDIRGLGGATGSVRHVLIHNNASLTNLDGLEGLSHGELDFLVTENPVLANLSGLSGLRSVEGRFGVSVNAQLESLAGLERLETAGRMIIAVNPLLTTLEGLSSLQSVHGTFQLGSNRSLVSLEGMPNLVSLGSLYVLNNRSLASLEGLEPLTQLSGLRLESNSVLADIEALEDVTGLRYHLSIAGNPQLTGIEALAGNSGALQWLSIIGNDRLRSLAGLEGVTAVSESLRITYNPELPDLDGLIGLEQVYGSLVVQSNASLAHVNGLQNLEVVGSAPIVMSPIPINLHLSRNPSLTDCSGVATVLGWPTLPFDGENDRVYGPEVDVSDNGPGASSPDQCLRSYTGPPVPGLPDIRAAVTGSWFEPATSGQGLVMHTTPSNTIALYFYGYDYNGALQWLLAVSEGPFQWYQPIPFEVHAVDGGSFEDFDPAQVEMSPWGTMTLTMEDCDTAALELSGEPGKKVLALQRVARVAGSPCTDSNEPVESRALTGSWFEPKTSGQGFAVQSISTERGAVYFYGFRNDGSDLWLTGTWEDGIEFGQAVSIPLVETAGGTFDRFVPEDITRGEWGTLQLEFEDCTTGTASLQGSDGEQTLDLTQLAGSFGLPCEPRLLVEPRASAR